MNISSENILIAIIYFSAAIYALLTGIFALAKRDIKIPGLYQFGTLLSKKLRGKDQLAKFEEAITHRKKAIQYGIFWILIGIVALAGGLFLLLVK